MNCRKRVHPSSIRAWPGRACPTRTRGCRHWMRWRLSHRLVVIDVIVKVAVQAVTVNAVSRRIVLGQLGRLFQLARTDRDELRRVEIAPAHRARLARCGQAQKLGPESGKPARWADCEIVRYHMVPCDNAVRLKTRISFISSVSYISSLINSTFRSCFSAFETNRSWCQCLL